MDVQGIFLSTTKYNRRAGCLSTTSSMDHRVHKEWQRSLSGVQSIMIEKLAQSL